MSETKRVVDLTMRMAQRSISSEFKGTALGRLWSFINPVATIAVYALIFGVVFRGEADKGVNSGCRPSRCGSAWVLSPGTSCRAASSAAWTPSWATRVC